MNVLKIPSEKNFGLCWNFESQKSERSGESEWDCPQEGRTFYRRCSDLVLLLIQEKPDRLAANKCLDFLAELIQERTIKPWSLEEGSGLLPIDYWYHLIFIVMRNRINGYFSKERKHSGYKMSKNVFLNLECESYRHFWDGSSRVTTFFPFRKTREAQKNCVGKPTQGGQNEPLF